MLDTQKTSGRKRDKSTKRKSILDAAVKVFLDEGFENASMDRISEVAKASKRTVYNHFSSKEDLLRAVIELFTDEMRSLKNIPYDKSRTLEEQLSEFADVEIRVARDRTWMGMIKFLLAVFMRYPAVAKEAVAEHAKSESGLTAWMRAASSDGRLAGGDCVLAAGVFSAMLGGAFTWPAVYQGELRGHREMKREIIRTFLAGYGK